MTDALTVAGLPLWGPLLLLVPLVGAVVAYLWQRRNCCLTGTGMLQPPHPKADISDLAAA